MAVAVMRVVVMGVSGCGKTAVGQDLAKHLGDKGERGHQRNVIIVALLRGSYSSAQLNK